MKGGSGLTNNNALTSYTLPLLDLQAVAPAASQGLLRLGTTPLLPFLSVTPCPRYQVFHAGNGLHR